MESEPKQERLWTPDFIRLNVANFMLFVSFYLLMPLLPIYLSETFGAGKHTIGVILSGYTVMALVARPVAGYIVDCYDRRRILLMVYGLFALLFGGYLLAGSLLLFGLIRTLHGAPFGATTVSCSTSAIDSLLPSRRAEGIGYYGLSNNLAMALAPTIALWIYNATHSFNVLFGTALAVALTGLAFCSRTRMESRPPKSAKEISIDRFFLLKGWAEALVMSSLSFSFGIISNYLAIYTKQEIGGTEDPGLFFLLASIGLMVSRLIGGPSLRRGYAVQNAKWGMTLSLCGYALFALTRGGIGYYASAVIIGLGNGHMFPGMQTIFNGMVPAERRGTANATLLTAWDTGIGLGLVVGGALSELFGYHSAFVAAALVNSLGVIGFWCITLRKRQN